MQRTPSLDSCPLLEARTTVTVYDGCAVISANLRTTSAGTVRA